MLDTLVWAVGKFGQLSSTMDRLTSLAGEIGASNSEMNSRVEGQALALSRMSDAPFSLECPGLPLKSIGTAVDPNRVRTSSIALSDDRWLYSGSCCRPLPRDVATWSQDTVEVRPDLIAPAQVIATTLQELVHLLRASVCQVLQCREASAPERNPGQSRYRRPDGLIELARPLAGIRASRS